jgi:hypothetical protein
MVPDERDFQVKETARSTSNIYYRVVADGVYLNFLLCISASQRSRTLDYELMMWCKFNARRLTNGRIVRADLNSVRDSVPESDEPLRSASILALD